MIYKFYKRLELLIIKGKMKTTKVSFTGDLEVFKSPTTKVPQALQEYFAEGSEADKLVKTIDKDLNVTVYLPENGDVFLRFEHSLSGGRDLGVYKFGAEKRAAEVIKYFKNITVLTNNIFKNYLPYQNSGDLMCKNVLASLKMVK